MAIQGIDFPINLIYYSSFSFCLLILLFKLKLDLVANKDLIKAFGTMKNLNYLALNSYYDQFTFENHTLSEYQLINKQILKLKKLVSLKLTNDNFLKTNKR